MVYSGLDSGKIGQHPSQPALVNIEHATALCLLFYCLLSLLLGANKEDATTFSGYLPNKITGFVEHGSGLLQVNDVNAIALGEDVFLHRRVPATGLVAKVSPGF